MTTVNFKVDYLPNQRLFRVTVKFGKLRFSEKMTISKFQRFARAADKPIIIGGATINFEGDTNGSTKAQVMQYFRKVADGYLHYLASQN